MVRALGQGGGWRVRGLLNCKTHLLTPVSAPAVLDGPEGNIRAWEAVGSAGSQGPKHSALFKYLLWAYYVTGIRKRAEKKTGPPTTLLETWWGSGVWEGYLPTPLLSFPIHRGDG